MDPVPLGPLPRQTAVLVRFSMRAVYLEQHARVKVEAGRARAPERLVRRLPAEELGAELQRGARRVAEHAVDRAVARALAILDGAGDGRVDRGAHADGVLAGQDGRDLEPAAGAPDRLLRRHR